MARGRRGELWIADLGMVAKVRPVLILSVGYSGDERAVVTYVNRTTSERGTQYEVVHEAHGMQPGVFDAQSVMTIPDVKLERRLGSVSTEKMAEVDEAVRAWLGL